MTAYNNLNLSIGLYEKALPADMKWEEKLICVRDTGYNFMEISIDETDDRIGRLKWDLFKKKKLRDMAERIGTPLLTMCLSANRRFPIGSSFANVQKKGLEMIMDAIIFAFNTGIRIVQVAGYDVIADEKSTKQSRETFGINLEKCVKLASSLGVMLAIENVDYEFADSLDKLMKYIELINSPWLQLYPDFGNLIAMRQDAKSQLKTYAGHIAAIHVKDTRQGVVRNIPFGEGIVDFISIFNTLKNTGFRGPFLLEMWADDKKDNYEIIKSAREWVIKRLEQVYRASSEQIQRTT